MMPPSNLVDFCEWVATASDAELAAWPDSPREYVAYGTAPSARFESALNVRTGR